MNKCMYEPLTGSFPCCDGVCKKGEDNYCPHYYVDKICEILGHWKREAGVKEPFLINYDYGKKKLVIYTTKPGYLIGLHGERIYRYSELLRDELRLKFADASGIPNDDLIELVECHEAIE